MQLKPSIKSEKNPWVFIIISLLLWVTIFIVDEINTKFHHSDFSVYYQAAQAFLNADQIYGIAFPPSTVGFYKYSPAILIFFIPFLLLPYKIASFIYIFFLTVSFIIFTNNLYNLYRTRFFDHIFKFKNLLLITILCFILVHLVRELIIGNVNTFILLLCLQTIVSMLAGKDKSAGIFFGLMVICKPYLLFVGLPLIIHRKWKVILSTIVSIMVFLILPALFLGFSGNIDLHIEWVKSMFEHNDYLISHDTLDYLIRHYIYQGFQIQPLIYVLFLILFYFGYYWLFKNKFKNCQVGSELDTQSLIIEIFLLFALIPNIFITDSQQFIFALPLITFVVMYVFSTRNLVIGIVFLLIMLPNSFNMVDLIGKNLSDILIESGALGISNLLLIGLVIYIFIKALQVFPPASQDDLISVD